MTRWQVSAVSAVLIAQICKSWTALTPALADRKFLTAPGSISNGTACTDIEKDWLSKRQVLTTRNTAIARLTAGSIDLTPVKATAAPDSTTPSEITASPAICRNAARAL